MRLELVGGRREQGSEESRREEISADGHDARLPERLAAVERMVVQTRHRLQALAEEAAALLARLRDGAGVATSAGGDQPPGTPTA